MMHDHNTFAQLQIKLQEIFQIDRPDLDFGIYRILNARSGQITEFLANDLQKNVQAAFQESSTEQKKALTAKLAEARADAESLGMKPSTVPLVQNLEEQIDRLSGDHHAHENAVYSHLLTFFSRYYDEGDFISQRRYKGDTYAIPYAGEEVMLHWANKDQYYTKSSENFSNYTFTLDDGRKVHFKLVEADTEKDNRKESADSKKSFFIATPRTVLCSTPDGGEYEEEIVPVQTTSKNGEEQLTVLFEYRVNKKSEPQSSVAKTRIDTDKDESLNAQAARVILTTPGISNSWNVLQTLAPTDNRKKRLLLRRHLDRYTTKNTADYFIHKDLGGFLRRELDFYIKSEVMNLDDVSSSETFDAIEQNLRMIQCLRSVAHDIIDFLAQLENFQKKLWLKKKFVVSADYCITLDQVPEKLYQAIAENDAQWEQWRIHAVWDGKDEPSVQRLKESPYWMLDTQHFTPDFKQTLLGSKSATFLTNSSLLAHSDNYQALRLLETTYREKVKCVYIDPPYNTDTSAILYKNTFKHSAWMTMMRDRLKAGKTITYLNGVTTVAINEVEQEHLGQILTHTYPNYVKKCISIVHNPRGQRGTNVSHNNDYAFFIYPSDNEKYIGDIKREEVDRRNLRDSGSESDRTDAKSCFYPLLVRDGEIVDIGDIPPASFHPNSTNITRSDGIIEIWPLNEKGDEKKWRYARQSVGRILSKLEVSQGQSALQVYFNKDTGTLKTAWAHPRYDASEHGTKVLQRILGKKGASGFSFPKSIHTVSDILKVQFNGDECGIALDYFAGSGTTGHATIEINREDDGDRKYILIEQGDYFDTVLVPRLKKVVYSADWKGGKPTAPETGISHAFKILRLESYEDTLNNLALDAKSRHGQLPTPEANEDYLLRYMLDVEAQGSLLSVEDFQKPFDYEMNIATDSAGVYRETKVDLVETFNYLIGLTVQAMNYQIDRGFVSVEGTLPDGDSCLVIWRDCEVLGYDAVQKLFDRLSINPSDSEFDVVYINGDHNIPAVFQQKEDDGGHTRVMKLRQIEPEFLDLMFNVDDV